MGRSIFEEKVFSESFLYNGAVQCAQEVTRDLNLTQYVISIGTPKKVPGGFVELFEF